MPWMLARYTPRPCRGGLAFGHPVSCARCPSVRTWNRRSVASCGLLSQRPTKRCRGEIKRAVELKAFLWWGSFMDHFFWLDVFWLMTFCWFALWVLGVLSRPLIFAKPRWWRQLQQAHLMSLFATCTSHLHPFTLDILGPPPSSKDCYNCTIVSTTRIWDCKPATQ